MDGDGFENGFVGGFNPELEDEGEAIMESRLMSLGAELVVEGELEFWLWEREKRLKKDILAAVLWLSDDGDEEDEKED